MSVQPGQYGEFAAPAASPPVGNRSAIGPSWLYWLARTLVLLGGILVFSAVPDQSTAMYVAGVLGIAFGGIATLYRVLYFPPRPSDFATRMRALWRNPWVLEVERRFFVAPVITLALVVFVAGQSALISVLAIAALIVGGAVIYLGSPHAFVNAVLSRFAPTAAARPSWFEDSELWKRVDLREPPEGFPDVPAGRIVAVVQNVRTKSYAVIVRGAGERPSSWSRWSHTETSWTTPAGTAEVEAYETWDGRPEAIITIRLPELSIVIEGVAGKETALSNARLLTRNLRAPQTSEPAKPALFSRVLGYAWIPCLMSLIAAPFMIAIVLGDVAGLLASNTIWMIVVAAVWPPVHSALLHTISLVRPRTFRPDHRPLKRRAIGVTSAMLAPSLWNALVCYFGFESLAPGYLWVFQAAVPILCGYSFLTMFLIRDPATPRAGR